MHTTNALAGASGAMTLSHLRCVAARLILSPAVCLHYQFVRSSLQLTQRPQDFSSATGYKTPSTPYHYISSKPMDTGPALRSSRLDFKTVEEGRLDTFFAKFLEVTLDLLSKSPDMVRVSLSIGFAVHDCSTLR